MRSEKDPVICSDNNSPDKNADAKHSSAIHVPPTSLPNPLLLSDELGEVNLPSILSACTFKRGVDTEECFFGKVVYKSSSITHRPSNYPHVLPNCLSDMFEACKRISPEFKTDDYSCVITQCRKGAASLPYLADIKHNSIVEGSSVFTIVLGADCKMDCLNTTGPLSPQTLPLKAGDIFTISKESLYHWTYTFSENTCAADEEPPMIFISFLNISQEHVKKEKVPRFGLPGKAKNAKQDILMQKNTTSMNYKRRTLILTDSVLSKSDERCLQNTSRNEFCIKKTMYNLCDIDGFEPEFQYTNTVVIAAGINDLSRHYHSPEQVYFLDLSVTVACTLIPCSLFVLFLEWGTGTPV